MIARKRMARPASLLACMVSALAAHAAPCIVADSGDTAALPPGGCEYTTPDGDLQIVDGLPVGTTINIDSVLRNFFGAVEAPGGALGGHAQQYQAELTLPMTGTGALAGFNRNIIMQVENQSHSAPRVSGNAVQSFDTDMFQLQGEVFGDPDFDVLRIAAGTDNGLPSPGHTTLTRLGPAGSDWNVDSFFDITYRIEFQGAPGSVLDGMDGSTVGTVRLRTGMPIVPEPSSLVLAGVVGSIGLGSRIRRRRKKLFKAENCRPTLV